MPGFNYGGYGDGTGWSSESGGTTPGGGSTGNTGNHDGGGSTNSSGQSTAEQKQIDTIRNNPALRKKLADMIAAAHNINPYAKVTVQKISKKGVMTISVTELDGNQAKKIGLSGLIMELDASGTKLAVGEFATGVYRIDENEPVEHRSTPTSLEIATTGTTDKFTYDPKSGTYSSTKRFDSVGTIKDLTITGDYSYRLHLDGFIQTIDATVINADPNNIDVVLHDWKGPQDKTKSGVKKLIKEFINFKLTEESGLLEKTGDIIVSASKDASKALGAKYQGIANEIAADVKNFQGKSFRNINDAMASLNKVLSNPKMKVSAADKSGLLNAWNHLNATDMAYKFGFLSKAFTGADMTMKVEKLRQKSITATETGDWGPVLLEVESWVLSGMATGFALAVLASVSTFLAATVGLPVSVVTVLGIIGISLAASLIDDKLADKINNWLISPAH
ncbi:MULTISPECIES: colicin-like pore-forming protein [unclassified Raoultella]|uniref:colicin-like pore-forming protein n=1 Tax=unclassified Raoultella TaxID=2627600 RepID=UPI001356850B|nr:MULTISPECIES: colicin-like pore-forming protein [unclassified Raoultella]